MSRRTWLVVLVGASMVLFTMGTRRSIGLLLEPVTADPDTDRESFTLASAAHDLILGLPLGRYRRRPLPAGLYLSARP